MLRHTCSACLVLYDSFTEFYVNRSNGLVADTPSQMDGRRNIVWTEGVLFSLSAIYKLLDECCLVEGSQALAAFGLGVPLRTKWFTVV